MSILAFQPEADRYYAEGYWRAGDLWQEFAARAQEHPEKTALHAGEDSVSYRDLEQAAATLSSRLATSGVEAGDVVLLLGRNSIEAAIGLLACFHRGAVAGPLPPMFGDSQISALADQANARALIGFGGEKEMEKCMRLRDRIPLVIGFTAAELAAEKGDAGSHQPNAGPHQPNAGPHQPDPGAPRRATGADDLAVLLHSSGTTSVPKGIMHSTNTLRYATEQILARWELTAEDNNLVVCEFGFVGSLVFGYLVTLLSGATGVLLPRWNADEALRLIERHRCSYVLYMPTHGADILRAGRETTRDCSSLRVLAAPGLSRERRVEMYEVFGHPPLADYGLSEIPGHVAHGLREPVEKMVRTEGLPFPGTDVQIVDRSGRPVPPGETGDVVVNGPSRFLGFLGNTELTRDSLTGSGAYITGDVGHLDADGHLVYGGRSKDIIRRGGLTLVPVEIEAALLRHPSIHEAAVVPLPDDRLGERACAALILEPGHDAPGLDDLQGFLEAEGIAKYSWPESVEVFEDFPRTPSLKVVKRELVSAILERAGAVV